MFKGIIIIILLMLVGVLSYLLYDQYTYQDRYMRDRVEYIERKTEDLAIRERSVMERERCDRELTRLKTIHKNVLDILSSYNTYSQSAS
jgi:hypothetical protein